MFAVVQRTEPLGVGEPDFKTPYHIRNAAIDSLVDGETQYTANRGLPELRKEISLYLSGRYAVSYDPEKQILVTIGASEAIDLALRAISVPGDEILVPEPSYVSYSPGVVFAGATPVSVETLEDNDFRLTAESLEKSITPQTKALILPYPNNPTGAVMNLDDLKAIAKVILAHNLFVISDEIPSEEHLFENNIVTYEGADDLDEKINYYLNNPDLNYYNNQDLVLLFQNNHLFQHLFLNKHYKQYIFYLR